MHSKRQFSVTHQQAINLIKQLKASNDRLNKSIGVDPEQSILVRLRSEQSTIDDIITKLDRIIQKLEQSYLDPDTARKIGTAKQQYRIQKDRRRQLIQSVELEQKPIHLTHPPPNTLPSHEQLSFTQSGIKQNELPTWHNSRRQTQSSQKIENTRIQMQREDQMEIDFELQQKLMRERNKQLNEVTRNLMNVQSMIQETNIMTYEQGEKLDIIDQQLFTTYNNTKEAKEQIVQANEYQKKSRTKYVFFSLLVLIGVIVTFVLILA